MAETSIKITLELADKAAQKSLSDFINKSGSADKAVQHLGHSAEDTFTEIGLHIGKATGLYDIFAGNLAANLAIKGLEFLAESAHKLFEVFIVEGVHAATEAESALNSLNFAFVASGKASSDATEEFEKFAGQLAQNSTFSRTAIIQNAALIESLGRLDEDGLKRATQAALNLAAATGKDLPEAANLLARAANGNVTALQRMGVVVQKGNDDAETFANTLAVVESRFDGAAANKVNTYAGAVLLASHNFELLTEEFGNVIVKNPVVIEVLKETANIFRDLADATHGQNGILKKLIGESISSFLSISVQFIQALDIIVQSIEVVGHVVEDTAKPLTALIGVFGKIKDTFIDAAKSASDFAGITGKSLGEIDKGSDTTLGKLAANLARLKDAADKGLGALASGASDSKEPVKSAADEVDELTKAMERSQARLKSFAEELVKQSEDAKSEATQALELNKAKNDVVLENDQVLFDQKVINEVEFLQEKQAIEEQAERDRVAVQEARFAADNERLKAALDQDVITQEEFEQAKAQLKTNFDQRAQLDSQKFIKQDIKDKGDLLKAERKLQDEKIDAVASTFGNLKSLMQTSSRELFAIGKAAAIAEASINTYQAITKTMASVPYPFNIPLAIAQGIAGFVQVSNIAATNPSFAQGGIVPGSSFSGDRIAINANSGEMVLNRNQQATLFDMANNGGGSGLEGKLDMLIRAVMGKDDSVTVNIGGKTVVDVLRSELAAGRTFA